MGLCVIIANYFTNAEKYLSIYLSVYLQIILKLSAALWIQIFDKNVTKTRNETKTGKGCFITDMEEKN